MKLEPITGTVFYFSCFRCGKRAQSNGLPLHRNELFEGPAMADLEGPAFRAFYCGHCAAELQKDQKAAPSA